MGSPDSSGSATALATVGTVLWCIQLIPQIIRNWYVRDCEGVPPLMFFLFSLSGIPFAIYFLVQTANTALIVQPHIFMFFGTVVFWQSLYYPPVQLPVRKSLTILVVYGAVIAGIEAGVAIPLRNLYNRGITWPNLIPGIIAAVLLAVGLLPPYWELWKRHGRVVGINFLFLFLDSTGAVLSTAAVGVSGGKIDILGLVLYIVVFALEYGIILSHVIWKLRVRYFGLSPCPEAAPLEDCESIPEKHRYNEMPSFSEPLRRWCRENIVELIARMSIKLRQGIFRTSDNEKLISPQP